MINDEFKRMLELLDEMCGSLQDLVDDWSSEGDSALSSEEDIISGVSRKKTVFLTRYSNLLVDEYLLNILLENGYNVKVLVSDSFAYLRNELEEKGVGVLVGDYRDKNVLLKGMEGVDVVFHFAGNRNQTGKKEVLERDNILGTRFALEAAVEIGVKRFVYRSTCGVYGKLEYTPADEHHPLADVGDNWYLWSRQEAEKLVHAFFEEKGLETIIIRPSFMYGPGNTYKGLGLAYDMIKRRVMVGDGKPLIHLVHAFDVANAAVFLAEKGVPGEAYNVVNDDCVSLMNIVEKLCAAAELELPRLNVPIFLAKLKLLIDGTPDQALEYFREDHFYSNKKLKSLGFKLKYPLVDDGLKETVNYLKAKQ